MSSNTESRIVIGYLDRPKPTYGDDASSKISKGFINVLFEEFDDGEIKKINERIFFDEAEEVFIIDGFQDAKARYHRRLIRIEAVPNNLYEEKNDVTRYVTFKNNIKEFNALGILGMLHMKLPSPLDTTDLVLPVIPSTRSFYIVDDGFAYGPFKFELSTACRSKIETDMEFTGPYEGNLLLNIGADPLNTKQNYISKVEYNAIKPHLVSIHGDEYLLDTSKIKDAPYSVCQYMMKNDIVGFLKNLADRRKITKPALTAIRMELQDRKHPLTQEGKDTILKICESAAEDSEWQKLIIDIVNNDESGKKLIESYVELNKENYIASWDKIAAEKHSKIDLKIKEAEQRLQDAKSKVAEQDQLLVNKQNEYEALLQEELNNVQLDEKIQERRQSLDSEIQERKAELNKLNAQCSELQQYANFEEAIKQHESSMDYLVRRKDQLEQSIHKVQQTLRSNEMELQTELRKLVPFVSTIIQAPINSDLKVQPFNTPELKNIDFKEMSQAQAEVSKLVNYIAGQMSKEYSRSYSNEFISSVLVAQAQSLISIFTGAPGLGKTSFVRLLKRILKMDERFIEVAVGRSWVSEREFIGFFNSLSNSFSPAPSGVYQFLKGVSNDTAHSAPLSLMLLDEANLSAIEHYGAFLINISDDEADKTLRLSKEEIRIPESLRIVATINHDLTTEALSPRLIDRAPVIPFDSFVDDSVDYIDDVESYSKLSFKTFSDLFGRNAYLRKQLSIDNTSLPQQLQAVVDMLADRDVKKGPPIILSRRKLATLVDYVYVLTSVLKVTAQLSDIPALTKAIDFAVLYYVLPSVQGSGAGAKLRLESLNESLENLDLELSFAKLSDILVRGEQNLETYNFFHY
ncbi:ATP-binding protein [Plesiomonas shigelloides]|uniref:ATP-binding protein n=1 Tax=Plesiomonas shigelloides TaxID=703 RepID=UPI001261E099|nr:ATP-binding protein [Plesiomonas shigelloides]KAB7660493.1 hypothetical protein GBN14_02510 [Plesiomonas shigelloides]